jgi:hypothetical protein
MKVYSARENAMSHTLRSLILLSFVGLIIGALWLTAWASADGPPVIIRAEPLAAGVTLEAAPHGPYQVARPAAAAAAQLF